MEENKSVVEYEEIQAMNPITHKMETVRIEKPIERTPEEVAENIKTQLAKYGLEPIQKVEITDPLSGEKRMITLNRTGYGESNLIAVLADPDMSRDKKDFALSMYLFERGKDNTSMIVDLIRYKGLHTKETRVFKGQIRMDFEAFLSTFCMSLEDQIDLATKILGIDVREERDNFYAFVAERQESDTKDKKKKMRKEYTYLDYYVYKNTAYEPTHPMTKMWAHQVSLAIHAYDTAALIRKRIDSIKDARERDKGKGIYLSMEGKPYTLNDPELDDIIKRDREFTQDNEKDHG